MTVDSVWFSRNAAQQSEGKTSHRANLPCQICQRVNVTVSNLSNQLRALARRQETVDGTRGRYQVPPIPAAKVYIMPVIRRCHIPCYSLVLSRSYPIVARGGPDDRALPARKGGGVWRPLFSLRSRNRKERALCKFYMKGVLL